jgi:hypothetical protein
MADETGLAGAFAELATEIEWLARRRLEMAHPEAHAEHGRADSEAWCASRIRAILDAHAGRIPEALTMALGSRSPSSDTEAGR